MDKSFKKAGLVSSPKDLVATAYSYHESGNYSLLQ